MTVGENPTGVAAAPSHVPPLPPDRRGRAARLATPLACGALVVAATVALHVRDPNVSGSWGMCPTQYLIGIDCPLCGGLRAVHALTDVDPVAAASSNLVVVLALPFVVLFWLRRVVVCWRGGEAARPLRTPTWLWWTGGVVLAVFTVLRNLPAGAWFHS